MIRFTKEKVVKEEYRFLWLSEIIVLGMWFNILVREGEEEGIGFVGFTFVLFGFERDFYVVWLFLFFM